MRRLDKEITDQAIIHDILNQSGVLRIAFAIDNIPHIVPVNYAHKDGKLYIHSAPEGNKIRMISKNNHVSFEMELYDEIVRAEKACNWTTKYRSVIGWGKISISENREEKIHGLDLIMQKYGSEDIGDYNEAMLRDMVLLVIDIETLSGKQSGHWE